MDEILNALKSINSDKGKKEKLLSAKDLDELYELVKNEDDRISKSDFGYFLLIALNYYFEPETNSYNSEELDNAKLEKVAGGKGFFKKSVSTAIAALTLSSPNVPFIGINSEVSAKKSQETTLSKKEIEKIRKELKVNISQDKNWAYIDNNDGENTITLVKSLNKNVKELNSTIDGKKITRIEDSFSLIKKIIKTDRHISQKIKYDLFHAVMYALAIPTFGFSVVMLAFAHDSPYYKRPDTTREDASIFPDLETVKLDYCKYINGEAFKNCKNLKSINLSNFENIDERAFENCENLENVSLPKLTLVQKEAFKNCKNLKSINLPNCENISECAFENCSALENIKLPNVKQISSSAFEDCYSLKTVDLPVCENIGEGAFQNCKNLKSVKSPNVKQISDFAFKKCTSLKSIDLPVCENISESAFEKCSELESVKSPNVKQISSSAFKNCSKLKSVDSSNLKSIGESSFEGCTSITELISDSVTSISNNAFKNCSNLSVVELPKCKLTELIGKNVFDSCNSIKKMNIG